MYEFVEKQPKNKLSVVYFVSGWLPTENRQLVALVPDTELEGTAPSTALSVMFSLINLSPPPRNKETSKSHILCPYLLHKRSQTS